MENNSHPTLPSLSCVAALLASSSSGPLVVGSPRFFPSQVTSTLALCSTWCTSIINMADQEIAAGPSRSRSRPEAGHDSSERNRSSRRRDDDDDDRSYRRDGDRERRQDGERSRDYSRRDRDRDYDGRRVDERSHRRSSPGGRDRDTERDGAGGSSSSRPPREGEQSDRTRRDRSRSPRDDVRRRDAERYRDRDERSNDRPSGRDGERRGGSGRDDDYRRPYGRESRNGDDRRDDRQSGRDREYDSSSELPHRRYADMLSPFACACRPGRAAHDNGRHRSRRWPAASADGCASVRREPDQAVCASDQREHSRGSGCCWRGTRQEARRAAHRGHCK